MFASTITIPCLSQPNYLHCCLHALVRNSYYKHRIIVLWSDPLQISVENTSPADDWERQGDMIAMPFHSVREFLAHHSAWLSDNRIDVVDVTGQEKDFFARYWRSEVFPGKTHPQGGVDIAYKNNVGLSMTDTEWTIPNWDCDFYPDKDWDRAIFDYALGAKREKEYLIPMHVQPQVMSEAAAWDAWRDSPAVSCHRLTMPTASRKIKSKEGATYDVCSVDEKEWFAFCNRWRRPGEQIRERCGERRRLHWVPWVVPTAPIVQAGGFNYQGSGYDIEFDDRLGRLGYTKVGFCDSFIMHKGFPPIESGVCPYRKIEDALAAI